MTPKTVKPNGRGASAPKAKAAKKAKTAKKATAKKSAASPATFYIRNLHGAAGGARLTLSDETRIQLEPRGQIGDVAAVTDEHRNDPLYRRNLGYIFEELTEEQGREIISKQGINAQSSRQSVMQHMTNQLGQKYTGDVIVEKSNEEASILVGTVAKPTADGKISDKQAANTEVARVDPPQEVQVPGSRPVPGSNAMPEGLTEAEAISYLQTPVEERAQWLAEHYGRNQEEAEAEDYRNSLRVSVEPTQRG